MSERKYCIVEKVGITDELYTKVLAKLQSVNILKSYIPEVTFSDFLLDA